MKKKEKYLLYGGLTLLFLFMTKMGRAAYYTITDWLIPEMEGFRDTPYWDFKQYTWGYGTKAPGPNGTITREQALKDMRRVVDSNFAALSAVIIRKLNYAQWAALMDFAYNLGIGAAMKLVNDINAGNDSVLEDHWKLYIIAGGVQSDALIQRRDLEWQIWSGRLN